MPIVMAGLIPQARVVLVDGKLILIAGKALVRPKPVALGQQIGQLFPLGGVGATLFLLLLEVSLTLPMTIAGECVVDMYICVGVCMYVDVCVNKDSFWFLSLGNFLCIRSFVCEF